MVTYDPNYPENNTRVSDGPNAIREKARQLKEDRIVDAGFLNGHDASYYSVSNHTHNELNLPTTAGESIEQYRVVYVYASNIVKKADNTQTSNADKILGVTLNSASAGNNITLKTFGIVENTSWDLIPGNAYYLGVDGNVIPIKPASGCIQKIGVALTDRKLFVQIGDCKDVIGDTTERKYITGVGGIQQYDVVYLSGCDIVSKADKNEDSHISKVIGIALNTAISGGTVSVKVEDTITNPSWNLTCGDIYFLSDNGSLTNIPPTTGFLQKVGVAEDTNTLFIQIGMGVKL